MKIQNLSKSFTIGKKKSLVLKNVSLQVKKGEILVILGPSGCGKTTLLNILAQVDHTYKGTMSDLKNEEIGYMFQTPLLFDWKTAFENTQIGLQIQNKNTKKKKREINKLLKKYKLHQFKDNYPKTLSGGMQQRIAFIRTIITEPDILLLDEPFSALDFETKLMLEKDLYDFVKTKKTKTIFVTHDIEEAIALGDRIINLTKCPATIKKEYIISHTKENPINRRQNKDFSKQFTEIWKGQQYEKAI